MISAVNVKSKDKMSETKRAKRTDKIKITFKLEANAIAPKGPRTIYVRIVKPDGQEWCDSPDPDHMFSYGTSQGYYAMKKSLQYNNEPIVVEIYVRKKETIDLLPGKYFIDVCLDDVVIGGSALELD